MPRTLIREVNINYEIIGEDGPWVVMITGGRRSYDEFVSLSHLIAAEGFRVLLHDRRNTGASDIVMDSDEVEEATWADDLHLLLAQLDASPAFIGGSSSGARTAILFAVRHPEATRALLLLRVTGGAFAAGRLPAMYYDQYIQAAEVGGMEAVCQTDEYAERITANPGNRERLLAIDPERYIAIMRRWRALFVAGAHFPVLGVSDDDLASITCPRSSSRATTRHTRRQVAGPRMRGSGAACCTRCRSKNKPYR